MSSRKKLRPKPADFDRLTKHKQLEKVNDELLRVTGDRKQQMLKNAARIVTHWNLNTTKDALVRYEQRHRATPEDHRRLLQNDDETAVMIATSAADKVGGALTVERMCTEVVGDLLHDGRDHRTWVKNWIFFFVYHRWVCEIDSFTF